MNYSAINKILIVLCSQKNFTTFALCITKNEELWKQHYPMNI